MYKIWIIPGAEKDVSCNLSTYSFSINYYSAILPNSSPWKIAVTSFTEGLIKGMWLWALLQSVSSLIDEQKIYCFIVVWSIKGDKGPGYLLIQFQKCDSWKFQKVISKVSRKSQLSQSPHSYHFLVDLKRLLLKVKFYF